MRPAFAKLEKQAAKKKKLTRRSSEHDRPF